ncbi:low density lipoprotein receptor adapter protein 1a [Electrophorus electricus]|uniref:PID domain-containing protein n=1 Tax=Electrophorus electricus TaxID=8005 RepID=A0A4W4GI61_ELEEL|nr:low density lipoprotein receptor adapter protein 1a [Electrophorus electricus]
MDVLKSAKRAIRSPGLGQQSWSAGKHQKLPEDWTDTRETLLEGMTFNLRHLGMTLVDQPKGEDLSAAAVKRIIATAKASGRKPPKVALKVSPQGILLFSVGSNQLLESISIYRISYCTADKIHDKVFAYIAQNQHNETLECHAFLCAKRKVAQAVTLTVAQAFRVAFDFWQVAKEDKEQQVKSACALETDSSMNLDTSVNMVNLKGADGATGNLLDFAESQDTVMDNTDSQANLEMDDGLDEAFSRFAEARTQVLDIGLTPLEHCSDPETNSNDSRADDHICP